MTRADFWCRVVGWLQLVAGALVIGLVIFLWKLILDLFGIKDIPVVSTLLWMVVGFSVLPMILTGLFTVIFANAVEQAREGLRGQGKVLLRVLMALSGLWAAGIIGFAGLHVPPVSLFAILALISTGIAIMGPDWTADLLKTAGPPP
jgi:hypothetical protein